MSRCRSRDGCVARSREEVYGRTADPTVMNPPPGLRNLRKHPLELDTPNVNRILNRRQAHSLRGIWTAGDFDRSGERRGPDQITGTSASESQEPWIGPATDLPPRSGPLHALMTKIKGSETVLPPPSLLDRWDRWDRSRFRFPRLPEPPGSPVPSGSRD